MKHVLVAALFFMPVMFIKSHCCKQFLNLLMKHPQNANTSPAELLHKTWNSHTALSCGAARRLLSEVARHEQNRARNQGARAKATKGGELKLPKLGCWTSPGQNAHITMGDRRNSAVCLSSKAISSLSAFCNGI